MWYRAANEPPGAVSRTSNQDQLPRLLKTVQRLFNWEDRHLHEFVSGRRVYAEPDPEDNWFGRKVADERQLPLRHLAGRVGDRFEYHYDFGNWRSDTLLEAILLPEPGAAYPGCIAGVRNGPP